MLNPQSLHFGLCLCTSLSVHLFVCAQSPLGLTTLVAAFVSMAPMHNTIAGLPGTASSDRDIMIPDKEEIMLATCTGLVHTTSAVR